MRWLVTGVLVLGACGSSHQAHVVASDAGPALVVAPPITGPDGGPFSPDVVSLRLRRSIEVRFAPDKAAKSIGTVASDTRVKWDEMAEGDGTYCKRWFEIEPRGWVCEKYLEPSKKAPIAVILPRLKTGEVVPGVYGKVTSEGAHAYKNLKDLQRGKVGRSLAGAVTVRKVDEVTANGKKYWKTQTGELIDAAKITLHTPSHFQGVRPGEEGAPPLPLAWAQSRTDLALKIDVHAEADAKSKVVKQLAPRTVVPIAELSPDGKMAHSVDGWIRAVDLHLARVTDPPVDLQADERWLDVDTDEQVVVAYDGTKPAYATLVSTGSAKWPTAPGIYRIWIKFAETDMNGQMGDEQAYSVATVPWTMFFARDLAFHTAYWHDRFGEARSHGCVNLAPIDARILYFWATPDVPDGWSMAQGIVERPGALVRIHGAADPTPEYKGYAKIVFDERQAQRAGAPVVTPPVTVEPETLPGPGTDGGLPVSRSEDAGATSEY